MSTRSDNQSDELRRWIEAGSPMPSRFSEFGGARIGVIVGGVRIGIFNATDPFARLSADRDTIALRCLFKFRFPRDKISGLRRYRSFFSSGLQIEHKVPHYPGLFVFWTFNFDRLKERLEALGYSVRD
jgi:hypothetical protein